MTRPRVLRSRSRSRRAPGSFRSFAGPGQAVGRGFFGGLNRERGLIPIREDRPDCASARCCAPGSIRRFKAPRRALVCASSCQKFRGANVLRKRVSHPGADAIARGLVERGGRRRPGRTRVDGVAGHRGGDRENNGTVRRTRPSRANRPFAGIGVTSRAVSGLTQGSRPGRPGRSRSFVALGGFS